MREITESKLSRDVANKRFHVDVTEAAVSPISSFRRSRNYG